MSMRVMNFVIDNAVTPTTANVSLTAQVLNITNGNGLGAAAQVGACRLLNIRAGSVTKQAAIASGTPQVSTLTPVGTTNGVTYSVKLIQLNPITEDYYENTYVIVTPAVGTISPTSIVTQLKAAINIDPKIQVVASGSTTLVITANAGYETFQFFIANAGLGLTGVTGTAGVYAVGVTPYTSLLQAGLTPSQFLGSASGYTKYSWIADIHQGATNNNTTSQPTRFNMFINQANASGTQSTDLITAVDVIFAQSAFITGTVKLL